MNKAKYSDSIVKLATVTQAIERYKLGRNSLIRLATDEGAIRHFGRAVRIDVQVLDRAIEQYQ